MTVDSGQRSAELGGSGYARAAALGQWTAARMARSWATAGTRAARHCDSRQRPARRGAGRQRVCARIGAVNASGGLSVRVGGHCVPLQTLF